MAEPHRPAPAALRQGTVADIDTMTQERMLTAYDTEQTALNSAITQLQSEIDAKRNEAQGIANSKSCPVR
jgi:hypothetical protein